MGRVCLNLFRGESTLSDDDFAAFWKAYPRRVKPLAARKAYDKARKLATAEAILAGVMLFNRHLPHEKRFIPHASTWLNAGQWMDELPGVRETQVTDWYEECRQMHNNECGLSQWRHAQRKDVDAIKAQGRKDDGWSLRA